jgi:hypothetical protein
VRAGRTAYNGKAGVGKSHQGNLNAGRIHRTATAGSTRHSRRWPVVQTGKIKPVRVPVGKGARGVRPRVPHGGAVIDWEDWELFWLAEPPEDAWSGIVQCDDDARDPLG